MTTEETGPRRWESRNYVPAKFIVTINTASSQWGVVFTLSVLAALVYLLVQQVTVGFDLRHGPER
jgi:hypothetical protein